MEWWVGRKLWFNLRLYAGIFLAGLRKTMKSLRITFMQIFYMKCIHEIRIYILIFSGGLNIKKKFTTWKTCTQISDAQITSVPGSWNYEHYQMCLRWSVSLGSVVCIRVAQYVMSIYRRAVTRIEPVSLSNPVFPPDWSKACLLPRNVSLLDYISASRCTVYINFTQFSVFKCNLVFVFHSLFHAFVFKCNLV
jgi:hypothetical protein